MIPVLLFPEFNPVIVQLGPFGIRWYALAYILGLVLGWRLARRLVQLAPPVATPLQVDDFLTWATLGVVLGGRLGYVLFYQPLVYLAHPLQIFEVWKGGMSFHGGAIGVAVAIVWFCRRNAIRLLAFADRVAVCTPIGLGLGRVANFINGELWGRPAPLSWPGAMVFPNAEPVANPSPPIFEALRQTVCAGLDASRCVPRYPSEIYEALLEGLVLLVVMLVLSRREALRARAGWLTGAFLVGYGLARITCEFFREPDAFLGFLPFGATMGQVLCIPMLIAGAWLIVRSHRWLDVSA
jgi:phosphatidylglycerol:prolipoprotein diacylglycerol transferase